MNLYQWVIAMNSYHFVNKMIRPKKEALAKAQAAKYTSEKALKEFQARLKKIKKQIAQIREDFEKSNNQLKEYMDQQKMYEAKLLCAESLLNNLSGEKGRWEATLAYILIKGKNLNGDVLISAASVAYTGPFPSEYRAKLVASWTE
jgi:dynein heavy chain